MTVHALVPGSQELALCLMAAWEQGVGAKAAVKFTGPYPVTRQADQVTCAECKDWLHA